MKISKLIQRPGGLWRAGRIVDQQWMSRSEFERLMPGRPLSAENTPVRIDGLPDGFRLWQSNDGSLIAVQES